MACLAARKGNKNDYYQQDQQNQKKEKHRNIKCQDKRLPRVREKKPRLKVDKKFFIQCESCDKVLYGSVQDGILELVKKWNARNSGK